MNIDTRVQLCLLAVATLSLGWTAGYYSRGDRVEALNTELTSYKEVEKLNITQTVKNLEKINASILANVNEIRSNTDWRRDKKNLERTVSDLASENSQQKQTIETSANEISELQGLLEEKQKYIDALYPVSEQFWLEEKTTKNIAGFEEILGLKNVQSDFVEINISNKEHRLYAGNYVESVVKESNCKIILSGIDYGSPERAQFTTVCKKI